MEETRWQTFGSYLLIASAIVPGMIVSGIFADWNVLPAWLWFIIAMVGGSIGGFLAAPRGKQFAGLGGGTIATVGVMAAIWGYWMLRSPWGPRLWKAEILIPFAIGILPGLGYYLVATRAWRTEEIEAMADLGETDEIEEDE